MDPITLIVTALVAGAAAGLQDTAGGAISDAYTALKGLITRRFGAKPEVTVAMEQAEQSPQVWTEPLKDVLARAGADQEPEIVRAAQELMALVEPGATGAGKYNVSINGNVQGMATGDQQHVQMRFGGSE
jgi:hypothetical protein